MVVLFTILLLSILGSVILFSARRFFIRFTPKMTKKRRFLFSLAIGIAAVLPVVFLGVLHTWNVFLVNFCGFSFVCSLIGLLVGGIARKKSYRDFCRLPILPLVISLIWTVYGTVNMTQVVCTEMPLPADSAITAPGGYRIALLADIHYGTSIEEEGVRDLARRVREDEVDMIFLCGDIVDESTTREEMETVFAILGQIPTTHGIYYIFGNHDVATYTQTPAFGMEDVRQAAITNGMVVLEDETYPIGDDLLLIGRKDASGERAPIADLTANADPNRYWIVLDHQPLEFEEKAAAGVDLQLSGHTHAGQVFPFGQLMRLFRINDLWYGHTTVGEMDAVVTSGVSGWGFIYRTEQHSEYMLLTLTAS